MKNKYLIRAIQVVYPSGVHDKILFQSPVLVENLETYRSEKKKAYNCVAVNLTYTEIPNEQLRTTQNA
jgi:hypothetical protein